MKYPNVVSVKAIADYNIIVTFETGEVKIFDVKPYIKGEWFGKLNDTTYFKSVRPCGNTVEWVGGQDIAPHELYELSTTIEMVV